jgi:hypothetical protein
MSNLRIPLATAAGILALTCATSSFAEEAGVEHRPNRSMLSTGVGIFVVSYGATAVAGAISEREADRNLFIPVVGPWINLTDRSCGPTDPCGNREDVNKAVVISSGVVQGAAVLMALGSFVVPETKNKRNEPSVAVSPVSFGTGAGIGAVGHF